MNRRLFFQLIVPGAVLASIVALFTGDRQAISLQIWLAVFMGGVAVTALIKLHDDAPFVPLTRLLIAADTSDKAVVTSTPTKRSRIIQGLLVRSRDNPRTFAQQLQPELVALANHFLSVNHGVDARRHPDRARAVLGDVHWLIETPSSGRTPTIDELERFVDIITNYEEQQQ